MKYLDHEVGIDSECVFEVLDIASEIFFGWGREICWRVGCVSYDAVVKE